VKRWIFIGMVLFAAAANADSIRLKNGNTILADEVRENHGKVEYSIGDDTYAIPKSLVEAIETGGSPATSGRIHIPIPPPDEQSGTNDLVATQVVRAGKLDMDALNHYERTGGMTAASAYYAAANFEDDHGSPEAARRYFVRALEFAPNNVLMLLHYTVLLLDMQRYQEAMDCAARATRAAPNNAAAHGYLGVAYYYSGRTDEAVRSLKRSLALRPNFRFEQFLRMVQADQTVEVRAGEQDSPHFNLHYEGDKGISVALRRGLLETLESHYSSLAGELGYSPRETIAVMLYTQQTFFDVTQAPAWAGALNDGKLRIPVGGIDIVTSQMSRILKHELTHSFLNQMTHGRCPVWLNEGVAQAMEGKSTSSYGRKLAEGFAARHYFPLRMLEGSFMNMNTGEALWAYAESLAAVETIREIYSMSDVLSILEQVGSGSSTESAMRTTIHSGYKDFEEEIGTYLKRRYGS